MMATLPAKTCSTCQKTEPWGTGWRHGSDPLGPYLSKIITQVFCSSKCEAEAMVKLAGERKAG